MNSRESGIIEVFIVWLILQLLVIGVISASISADVLNKEADCNYKSVSRFGAIAVGVLFPLAAFVPESPSLREFCEAKESESK